MHLFLEQHKDYLGCWSLHASHWFAVRRSGRYYQRSCSSGTGPGCSGCCHRRLGGGRFGGGGQLVLAAHEVIHVWNEPIGCLPGIDLSPIKLLQLLGLSLESLSHLGVSSPEAGDFTCLGYPGELIHLHAPSLAIRPPYSISLLGFAALVPKEEVVSIGGASWFLGRDKVREHYLSSSSVM